MDIKKIESKLILLVPVDQIPMFEIFHSRGNSKIKKHFSFSGIEAIQSGDGSPALQFGLGLTGKDENQIKILSL